MFDLLLVDPKPELCNSWKKEFQVYPKVQVYQGFFQEIEEFDCMVSAANSFGMMDGGVDLAIIDFFGKALEDNVQKFILEHYFGEQPVGTSLILETGNESVPFLAHTPTMRVPMAINGTDNVYLAMKAMLEAVWHHNQKEQNHTINRVVCPGLGTGYGKMSPDESARQMRLAYENFFNPIDRIDWHVADRRQKEIVYGGNLGFYHDKNLRR